MEVFLEVKVLFVVVGDGEGMKGSLRKWVCDYFDLVRILIFLLFIRKVLIFKSKWRK